MDYRTPQEDLLVVEALVVSTAIERTPDPNGPLEREYSRQNWPRVTDSRSKTRFGSGRLSSDLYICNHPLLYFHRTAFQPTAGYA